ncbi:hypothetical protein HDV02_003434 [Globomyces sp. JEL0801]|nr:hypothetical protein HDV02_003434 [Globomyces sp. JEL0801]
MREFTIDSKGHESFSTSGYGVKFMDQEPSFPIIESKSKHRKKGKKFQPKRTKKTVYDYGNSIKC